MAPHMSTTPKRLTPDELAWYRLYVEKPCAIVGTAAVAQLLADRDAIEAENERLRDLLEEAMEFLHDPPAYRGTATGERFDVRVKAALGPTP